MEINDIGYREYFKSGIVIGIIDKKWVIVNLDGNGVRIPYNEGLHSELSVGDEILLDDV